MKEFFEKLSAERCSDLEIRNIMSMSSIFEEDRGGNLNDNNLYLARFGRIPNRFHLESIVSKKASEYLLHQYKDSITDCYYDGYNEKEKRFEKIYYFLFDDLMVSFQGWRKIVTIKFLYRKTDTALVNKVANELKKFKQQTRNISKIELIISNNGFRTTTMEIVRPKLLIEDNYNDDFLPVHETILNRLRKKNDKGLVLLHGKPGTGKTSYIRYLITKIRKHVIFLPPNMAASITDPSLMNVLVYNPNSVFVIEDAENIIIDRNRSGSSSVSALLNLADGLLSDCLNIQIICSFNTDLSRVDSALLRKGRLIAKYEFLELEAPKAQKLSNKLGFSSVITAPMSLAAVYNQHEKAFTITSQRRTIGYQVAG